MAKLGRHRGMKEESEIRSYHIRLDQIIKRMEKGEENKENKEFNKIIKLI